MTAPPLSRAEIVALPPVINLCTLARVLGISEPTVRERARSGDLAALGITIVKLGVQYRVVTASVLAFLGIDATADSVGSEARPRRAARQARPSASALRSVRSGDGAG